MKVIAHRGACTEALENSWDAFTKAVECGSDRIELDIHLTADDHLVIIHDEDFNRTAGSNLRVSETSRETITRDIRLKNGEQVPFLDEVLSKFLDRVEFNIEVKSHGLKTIEILSQTLQKFKDNSKIIVSSFNLETCQEFSRKNPTIRCALLWDKDLWWPWAFASGPKRFMKDHHIRIFHPEARLVTAKLVKQVKKEGWEIYPYIGLKKEINPEELWSFLATLNVDGLCTNFPRKMKLWLKEATDDRRRYSEGMAQATDTVTR